MPALLVIIFVVVPLIELVVILQVGELLGVLWTVVLLVLFSIVGAALLRQQGRVAWRAFRAALEEGRWPGDEVTQGALVIVGGTLLLTPGFVTDGVGFLLLIPLTRSGLARMVRARATPESLKRFGAARSRAPGTGRRGGDRRDVLDVEVVDIEREQRGEGPARDSSAIEDGRDDPPAGGTPAR